MNPLIHSNARNPGVIHASMKGNARLGSGIDAGLDILATEKETASSRLRCDKSLGLVYFFDFMGFCMALGAQGVGARFLPMLLTQTPFYVAQK